MMSPKQRRNQRLWVRGRERHLACVATVPDRGTRQRAVRFQRGRGEKYFRTLPENHHPPSRGENLSIERVGS